MEIEKRAPNFLLLEGKKGNFEAIKNEIRVTMDRKKSAQS